MTSKNVLFIYPSLNHKTAQGLESNLLKSDSNNIEISLLYLEAFLKKKIPEIECEYLDFRIEDEHNAEKIFLQLL